MSKRFGRNQRRCLREALVNAKASDDMNRGLLVYQRQKINDLKMFIDEVIAIVGNGSILNPHPRVVHGIGRDRRNFDVPVLPPLSFNNFEVSCDEHARVITLNILETAVAKDKFSEALHFRVQLADEKVMYSMSKSAVLNTPKAVLIERLHREIARQLAHQLAEVLKR